MSGPIIGAVRSLAGDAPIRDVVLMCSAVNEIDLSVLKTLDEINQRLSKTGVRPHLSGVKGAVMDGLEKTHFLDRLDRKCALVAIGRMDGLDRCSCLGPISSWR